MKCTIPEISWHNREPVLSIDIQPVSEKFYRLATGGADCHVLIWQLALNDNGGVKIEALSDLTRHQRAVNCVRWSPSGQHLATADDDANIIIWQLKTDNIPLLEGETNDKETWIVNKVIRGHKEDVYDLCWSPNGLKLFSGSIDNSAILWDFTKGKCEQILTDHKGFVQGVSWDPKGQYLATVSTDRICRIYDNSGKHVKARLQKGLLPVSPDHYLFNKEVKYFHDDTFKSFFRRLDFSPDGSLLAVPSGRIEIEEDKRILNCALVFAVETWTGPIAAYPSGKQCSTVIRFCPILFELQEDGPTPLIALPFRMIFAVGTEHDVILYDTQQTSPSAYLREIHYTRLTDLTWSQDGLLLMASSTDGFCALITFEPNELGNKYVKEESETEENPMDVSGCEEIVDKDDSIEPVKPKKMNLLEKWTIKTPKRGKYAIETCKSKKETHESTAKRKLEDTPQKSDVICKRIKPIAVQDNKINNENADGNVEKLEKVTSSKSTPLVKFFKKTSNNTSKQGESKNPLETSTTALVLDEVEARDAWKCENIEIKPAAKHEIINLDDYSEDFSLHLEDTNSKLSQATDTEKVVDIKCIESEVEEAKVGETVSETKIDQSTEKSEVNKTTDPAPDSKSIAKRRIPLITLSSPKQKKK